MSAADPILSTEELVNIATFPDPASGNVARSALEAAGIPVFLQGENANSLLPVAFETQLFVRSTDEVVAREVLDDVDLAPVSLDDVTAAEEAGGDEIGTR